MTRYKGHCDDKIVEHCNDKRMAQCDDKGQGALCQQVHGEL